MGKLSTPFFFLCGFSVFIIDMKNIVHKTIIVLFLLSMTLFLKGQEYSLGKTVYEDFGTWSLEVENNKISISAYVTQEIIKQEIEPYEIELQILQKRRKEGIDFVKTKYKYELYLQSNSIYNGDTTSTWIYSGRVFINGVEITKEQFPDGFTLLIKREPTLIYWYETTLSEKMNFYVIWENAVYENRLHD